MRCTKGREGMDESLLGQKDRGGWRSRAIFQAEIRPRWPFSSSTAINSNYGRFAGYLEKMNFTTRAKTRTSFSAKATNGTESLRPHRTDPSPWPRLPFAGDVPAHLRPGLSNIYFVHLARKTRSPSHDGYVTVILRCYPGKSALKVLDARRYFRCRGKRT